MMCNMSTSNNMFMVLLRKSLNNLYASLTFFSYDNGMDNYGTIAFVQASITLYYSGLNYFALFRPQLLFALT